MAPHMVHLVSLRQPCLERKAIASTATMRGRQYYYSFSLGAAYRVLPELSAFAGVRGVYALSNYYGYVRNIKVGNVLFIPCSMQRKLALLTLS